VPFLFAILTLDAMALRFVATVAVLAQAARATELTSDNWDAETSGKSVFIKFQAPW